LVIKAGRTSLWLLAACTALAACASSPGEEFYQRALRLEKVGGPAEEVLRLYDFAVKADPSRVEYRTSRGRMYFDVGDYEHALADMQVVVQREPQHAYSYYMKGLTEGKLARFDDALSDCRRAVQLEPKNDQFYNGVALSYLALGKLQESLKAIDTAMTL